MTGCWQAEWEGFQLYRWLASVLENPSDPVVKTVWLGLSDEEEELLYAWDNGLTVDWVGWPPGGAEPRPGPDRNCVFGDLGGLWRSEVCSATHFVLCQHRYNYTNRSLTNPSSSQVQGRVGSVPGQAGVEPRGGRVLPEVSLRGWAAQGGRLRVLPPGGQRHAAQLRLGAGVAGLRGLEVGHFPRPASGLEIEECGLARANLRSAQNLRSGSFWLGLGLNETDGPWEWQYEV